MIYRVGNLLNSNCDYICHQVNCQGRMASGIAKQIRERWPVVYDEYKAKYDNTEDDILRNCSSFEFAPDVSEVLLGDTQFIPVGDNKTVVNMFGQQYYGYDGKRYTSYDAFWNCLNLIKKSVPKGRTIGFPCKIGCDRGGANWNVIEAMIFEVLDEDYEVYIYCLEDNDHVSR